MRKLLVLMLSVAMVAGVIGGCGKSEDINKGGSAGLADSVVSENKDDKETENNNGPTKEGDVLYEDENVKLVFKSFNFQMDGEKPYMYVDMEAENKTEHVFDSECLHSTMNSYMAYASSYDTLEANTETKISVLYDSDSFENTGISKSEDVKELAFTFNYWSQDRDLKINIDDYQIKLYPNADRDYDIVGYEMKDGDIVLVDEDGYKMIYVGQEIDGRTVEIQYYVVNETDKEVSVAIGEPHAGDTLTRITPDHIPTYAHKEGYGNFTFWAKDETVVNNANEVSFVIEFLGDDFVKDKDIEVAPIILEK